MDHRSTQQSIFESVLVREANAVSSALAQFVPSQEQLEQSQVLFNIIHSLPALSRKQIKEYLIIFADYKVKSTERLRKKLAEIVLYKLNGSIFVYGVALLSNSLTVSIGKELDAGLLLHGVRDADYAHLTSSSIQYTRDRGGWGSGSGWNT